MANSVLLSIGAAGSLLGWSALLCGLLPPAYEIYSYLADVKFSERRKWLHLPFAFAALLVALKQLCFAPVLGSTRPNEVTKTALKPWHRSSIVLRRVFHLPCWMARLGVPSSLTLLDLLVFVGVVLLNWWLLLIIMNQRLRRGQAACFYLRPKQHAPSHEAAGFFSWFGMEGFALLTGFLSNIMIGWYCVLPVSRRSVFLEMLGLSWESAIKYHRWIGFHTTFVTALHTACYIAVWVYANGSVEYDPEGSMLRKNMLPWGCADGSCTQKELVDLAVNMWGFGAFLLMLVMVAFSLPVVRRRFYEIFYFVHLLWMPMVIMAQLHCGSIYYLAPGLACHCVDKMLGLMAHFGSILARVQRLGPDVMEIVVATPLSYSVKPGQYILINVPDISVLQWHPFSVTWARQDAFALHIRAAGDWTHALHTCASRSELKVKVKGAYGKDVTTEISGKDALVLWAGGLGLTYVYSIAEHAGRSGMPVYLRLVVRTRIEERSFASLLDSLAAVSPGVDIKMWVTRLESEDPGQAESYGTATCSESSSAVSGIDAAGGVSGVTGCVMPMSSVVPSSIHALTCGVAIFCAYLGLELANDVAKNTAHPFLYPEYFYLTLLRQMLYPILFAMASALSTMLMFVPMAFHAQKLISARRAPLALQSVDQDTLRTNSDNGGFTTIQGCRPNMAVEWDSIATSLGPEAADVAVFVAGPNGLVSAVEQECGERTWHVHRWHLDAEAWEW